MNGRGRSGSGGTGSSSEEEAERISRLSPVAQARLRALRSMGLDDDDDDFDAVDRARDARDRDDLTDVAGGTRLQKVLAAAGVGSRRHCEELIGAGRVEVDGQTVRRFGARVDPENQIIRVDGKRIPSRQDIAYLAFNKPPAVLTAMSDDRGRKTITDYLGDRAERLFHVGRLDYETEGLMLLTNDGELAHRLAHPSYEVAKTYLADVPGPIPRDLGRRLAAGIELEDGVAVADKFRVLEQSGGRALVEITLHEGRKHIVRRMLAEAGHPVIRLVRHRRRTDQAGQPAARRDQGPDDQGDRRALRRRRPLARLNRGAEQMTVRAIRGAVQVDADDRDAILEATAELVTAVLSRNDLTPDEVISVLFTVTPDLTAEFPALAARKTGLHAVPLMCATEIPVRGAMPRVVRLMAHVETDLTRGQIQHVYLRGAVALRQDIAQ